MPEAMRLIEPHFLDECQLADTFRCSWLEHAKGSDALIRTTRPAHSNTLQRTAGCRRRVLASILGLAGILGIGIDLL